MERGEESSRRYPDPRKVELVRWRRECTSQAGRKVGGRSRLRNAAGRTASNHSYNTMRGGVLCEYSSMEDAGRRRILHRHDGSRGCVGLLASAAFPSSKAGWRWSTSCTNSLPSERAAKNLPKELFSMQGQCDDGAYGDGHVLDCATTLIPARVGSGCI